MEVCLCERAGKAHHDVRIAGSKLPDVPLPPACPGCGIALDLETMRKHNYVCGDCGHHFRLGADAWIALMADRGSWKERWAMFAHTTF